ncbi:unnamed protein product [Onchocerca flexuosa]|uniref:ULP_PROTEASE domain-containing protein n=1 Tax=Onchocerca flexuosa TaxID=387005 RepID=A0A183HEE7_9BILA|nr:unnamed protein product [Onchocerca flexuosa]
MNLTHGFQIFISSRDELRENRLRCSAGFDAVYSFVVLKYAELAGGAVVFVLFDFEDCSGKTYYTKSYIMADEYKEEASEWVRTFMYLPYKNCNDFSEKNEGLKDESNEEEMADDREEGRTVADVKEDEMNVEEKDEESIEIKEAASSKPFNENLNKSSSEMNDTTSDLKEIPEVTKEEKLKPKKRALLDEPIVREGKRQRHAVERLAAISSPPARKASLDAVGSGTSLGDIEFGNNFHLENHKIVEIAITTPILCYYRYCVNNGISKAQNETLKWLHRLCYGTPGTATSRKRDLRRFNGFAFDDKSTDFDKKKTTAMKLTNNEVMTSVMFCISPVGWVLNYDDGIR